MIIKIAWKNIWRNKRRSFVVIGAVIFGICAVVFSTAFMNSFMGGFLDSLIENQYSHIQIHHPKFKEDKEVKYYIPNAIEIQKYIENHSSVKAVTTRILSNGMISTANGVRGVQVMGVFSQNETLVTGLNDKIIEGSSLDVKRKNAILIDKKLAEKLKVKLRSKVVLTVQDKKGEITAAAFKVVGLINSKSNKLDEMRVYVKNKDLSKLIGIANGSHELAVFFKNPKQVQTVMEDLQARYPEVEVESWRELAPELEMFQEQLEINMIILMTIIMLALIFGIINTMLMAILERVRELGVLMAVGMNKIKVFFMIVLETVFLSIVGGPIGLLLGFLIVTYLGHHGIDLSMYSEGLQEFGMNDLVKPYLPAIKYLDITIMIIITAILASIYPAYRAIRLKPIDAVRKV